MVDASGLSGEQRREFAERGFVRIDGFASQQICDEMLADVVELSRRQSRGESIEPAVLLPEANLRGTEAAPEALVSKIFRLHRRGVFAEFARSAAVTDLVADLVSDDLDCFLSQFIFKNPGAWGQPWHQDSYYFPFEPPRPIVGAWLAVTRATLENGCLHVLPGSHHEPVHVHEPDHRPDANYGYVEIVDHDMTGSVPVLMEPGDLLLFDSHLMHRSTDNESDGLRAAMVYHYATAGTVERRPGIINDFVRVRSSKPLSRKEISDVEPADHDH